MNTAATTLNLHEPAVRPDAPTAAFPGALAEDISAFGPEAAFALTELPSHIADLNRTYRHLVAQRALWKLPAIEAWQRHPVNVFLRHDAVYVFAIHHHPHVGMANFVELCNASFVVDAIGRDQTLRKSGTLPNLSTVHAFVAGEMTVIGDECPDSDFTEFTGSSAWHPVYYRPDRDARFMTSLFPGPDRNNLAMVLQPVHRAARVRMIPGQIKVWCQQPNCIAEDGVSTIRTGEGV